MSRVAAIIGSGVIGGGWTARFLLMGWDVRVFDPDPEAERKLAEVLTNARAALPGLIDVAMPPEGRLSFHTGLGDAVSGADWVQESVPERLELKHRVFAAIQADCSPDAVIGSSTAGFGLSQLTEGALRPGQIIVAHPCNPVYLLPLVEVAGTEGPLLDRACALLSSLGMYPLRLRAETDGRIADRLLQSVWREALRMIRDGVATTSEIDDAIRMGFGLRWAQMGLFESCRIAGGDAGTPLCTEHSGRSLSQPSGSPNDAPHPADVLTKTIAEQSGALSGLHSIRELQRIQDTNLVTILRGLKAQNWGAGAALRRHEQALAAVVAKPDAPMVTSDRAVPLDWTDYNGHMNEARYLQAFGDATDRFMEIAGCDAAYIAAGHSFFTAETHIRHVDEVKAAARIRIETLCLRGEGAKMHLFHQMFEADRLLATAEHFLLHVSLETRRVVRPRPPVADRIAALAAAHAALPRPEGIGRAVGRR